MTLVDFCALPANYKNNIILRWLRSPVAACLRRSNSCNSPALHYARSGLRKFETEARYILTDELDQSSRQHYNILRTKARLRDAKKNNKNFGARFQDVIKVCYCVFQSANK